MPTVGKRYYGPHDAAIVVLAEDGDALQVLRPAMMEIEMWTQAQFAEFTAGSDRRSIDVGEERRVLMSDETTETEDGPRRVVYWMDPQTMAVHRANGPDWDSWRAGNPE